MATDLREEIRRLKNDILKLSAEIGGKNQKTEYIAKQLKEGSTSLNELKQETDHLSQAYKEEKIKVKMAVLENERLVREIETQRKEIEQKAKEIKKRDAQLDFKNKQLLVLRMLKDATEAPQKVNSVQGKRQGVENMSGRDKGQLQIGANGLRNQLAEEKDYEPSQKQTLGGKENRSNRDIQEACKVSTEVQTDTNGLHNEEKDYELSQKQTLVDKEHRSNHDLQELPKVPIEIISVEDDENSIDVLDDWRMEDFEDSGGEECNSFEDILPPIPPPESSVDPCNDMPNNSSDLPSVLPIPKVKMGDECGKGDIEGSGVVECNASEDMFPPIPPPESLVDPCSDMPNNCSDLSIVLSVPEVKKGDEFGKGDIKGSGVVDCNAFQDMFPPLLPPESLVDPCTEMLNNCSDLSIVLPALDCEITDMEWLSTFVDDFLSAGDITVGIDFSDNNKNDDSATVLQNSSSSCSGGKTMALSPDIVVPGLVARAHDQQFSVNDPPQI
ncbi:hypothetical protein MKW98_013373 [Papaver atlanticum]|uniref:Uncharacterized protein n=1 Tax=Papaver atlanticum TaxID=357466 RepID=A0AAD4XKS9_9MAGN|nr:hypothetical protein MKW98_013373 [Papaver atlanticum]